MRRLLKIHSADGHERIRRDELDRVHKDIVTDPIVTELNAAYPGMSRRERRQIELAAKRIVKKKLRNKCSA